MPTPEGFHTVTPYLLVPEIPILLKFLSRALEAELMEVVKDERENIVHAEVQIGDSRIMMGRANAEWASTACMFYLYVDDPDAVFAQALQAGATVQREMRDEPYGDRAGGVIDPVGNSWWFAKRL